MLRDFPFSSFNVAYAQAGRCCTKPATSARMVDDGETAPEGRFHVGARASGWRLWSAAVFVCDRVLRWAAFVAAPQDARTRTQPANKPTNSSQPPAFSIPVEPLGFFAPGAFYQGLRISLVSLDFIDENRLLFTFRTPGLIRRAASGDDDEREIRAMVLSAAEGNRGGRGAVDAA